MAGSSAGATSEISTSTSAGGDVSTSAELTGGGYRLDIPFPDLPACGQRSVSGECRSQCDDAVLNTVWPVCGAQGLAAPAPFHPMFLDCSCNDPLDMLVADLDGDGIDDVAATCGENFPRIVVWFGGAERPMACPWRHGVGHGAYALAAADFDLDGRTDLAALNVFDETIGVYRGGDDRQIAPQQLVEVPGTFMAEYAVLLDMVAADVDADGAPDLVVHRPERLDVLRGDGKGGFALTQSIELEGCWPPRFVDLDVDGALDVVLGCEAELRLVRGDGLGGFIEGGAPLVAVDDRLYAFTIAEMTGDAWPDLVYVHADGLMFAAAEGPAKYGATSKVGVAPVWRWMDAVELDGEPGRELVFHGDADHDDLDSTFMMVGDVEQGFTLAAEVEHPGNPMPPWFGDFNGDGRVDLVLGLPLSANFNPGVYFLESAP